jgi:putative ABC transport system permease protein
MSDYILLSYWDLLLASLLLLLNGALSLYLRLGLERRLAIAGLRMILQLGAVGLVLKALFATVSPWLTGLVALAMILFAGREIVARQERRLRGLWAYGLGVSCMAMAALAVTLFALTTQIQADPWYHPRFALPLLGMVLGNTMTGIALGLDNLTAAAAREKSAIEAQLALGATRTEALRPFIRRALRAALMPTVNAMAAMGLVSLPGMMTGQILSGIDPVEATKYQIFVMFLIAGGTGLGAVSAVFAALYRLTDERHRLRLERLAEASQ